MDLLRGPVPTRSPSPGILRRDWSPADLDATLPPGRAIDPPGATGASSDPAAPVDGRAARPDRRRRCASGRRVAVQSAGPIDALARDVWRALPFRVRLRASVATWAFDNANRFDLVALPKLAGVAREPSDLILARGRRPGPMIRPDPDSDPVDIHAPRMVDLFNRRAAAHAMAGQPDGAVISMAIRDRRDRSRLPLERRHETWAIPRDDSGRAGTRGSASRRC